MVPATHLSEQRGRHRFPLVQGL